jgi:Family of unknown function (DUF6492)
VAAKPDDLMSLAFVTPSYGPDFERCALLVESLNHFAHAFTHYLIVDAPDVPQFRALASGRTRIIDSREVMDPRFVRLPLRGGTWCNWRTLPMRGWISQQIRKLAAPRIAQEDTLVMIDSDTAFVRQFSPDHVLEGGKVGLLDVDYCADMVPKWTGVAESLLELKQAVPLRGHVGHLIAWDRAHLCGLQAHIETATGLPWQVAIGRKPTFSEYILYGVYIRAVVGYAASRHAPTARPLIKQPWAYDLRSDAGRKAYFSEIEPENIGVMIHSKDGIAAQDVRRYLDPIFKAAA